MSPSSPLEQIEAIKCLKARYFRCMDSKDWQGLADCFTEDLVADFRAAPGMLSQGRDNYMAALREAVGDAPTVHHGHMPEIELTGADTARGIWAMDDIVELPGLSLRGWGHYHERYRRESGSWRICHIRLTRIRLLINGEEQPLTAG
ncbi:MAG: nuclear transport factor 2 family protein [Halioglobus sp.]|nr:nuclear transport factor 2 family protein [Halioglobus sp.]